jgi:hypothetical protein
VIACTKPRSANSQRRLRRTNRDLGSLGILQSAPSSTSDHPYGVLSCAKTQKHLSASPLFATLTHSLSRNPFVCHSYANTRDRGASPSTFRLGVSVSQRQIPSLQSFADSLSLLQLFSTLRSFVFNRLRTLRQKHRGWGVGGRRLQSATSTSSLCCSSQSDFVVLCFHGRTPSDPLPGRTELSLYKAGDSLHPVFPPFLRTSAPPIFLRRL